MLILELHWELGPSDEKNWLNCTADSAFPWESGNSVILGVGGWIEEILVVEELANNAEDFVRIDSLVVLVDGNPIATPVGCIDRVTA